MKVEMRQYFPSGAAWAELNFVSENAKDWQKTAKTVFVWEVL